MCLIGVTIVITMTMLLQVAKAVEKKADDAATEFATGVPENPAERDLRDRIAALQAAITQAQVRPDVDPLARRATLRQELRAKSSELDELEEQQRELEAQLRELLVANPEAATLREVLELVRIRDNRAAELSRAERRKQISFIIDEAESLRPIIFEVSAARIVVTDALDGVAIRIAAGTINAQCMDALKLFAVLARDRPSYILMVVTASGIATYRTLLDAIATLPETERPRVGVDIIPDGSFVSPAFPSASPGELP